MAEMGLWGGAARCSRGWCLMVLGCSGSSLSFMAAMLLVDQGSRLEILQWEQQAAAAVWWLGCWQQLYGGSAEAHLLRG